MCVYICFLCIQVEDSIAGNKLDACKDKYTNYIDDIIKQIRTDLPMKLVISLESLIILEVHGEFRSQNIQHR